MEAQERTPPVQIAKSERGTTPPTKPPFRVVADDSKPLLRDPLLTSDPMETEQILLQPPPLNRMDEALSTFDHMATRNVITWNALIAVFILHGEYEEALLYFRKMQDDSVEPDYVTCELYYEMSMKAVVPNRVSYVSILSVLSSKGAIAYGRWIHASLVGKVIEFDVVLATTLINLYGKGGSLSESRKVFDRMTNPNVVSWNALVAVHAQNDEIKLAQQFYYQMHQEGFVSTGLTFVSILDTCEKRSSSAEGKRLHVLIRGNNLEKDLIVGNALIDMYGKCQSIPIALELLDGMPKHNDLTWTIMITNCARGEYGDKAFKLLDQMLQEAHLPGKVTFIAILDACLNQSNLTKGMQMHALLGGTHHLLLDNVVGNALLNMYSKCGKMSSALEMFDMLHEHDVISWTALVSGYAQEGQAEEALSYFNHMLQQGVMPNNITYLSAVAACSSHVLLLTGKNIHAVVLGELNADIVTANSLLNLYGKCGCIEDAQDIFDSMLEKDAISWSAMIAAYAQHGEDNAVLQLFYQMQQVGVRPNHVTFLSVISAWGHTGRVEEGYYWFCLMDNVLSIEDHYNCMVDLLGRAGRLDEAESLLAHGSSQITLVSIMALLSACKHQVDVERGERFAKFAFMLFPENAEPYVMLANVYKSVGRVEAAQKGKEVHEEGESSRPPQSDVDIFRTQLVVTVTMFSQVMQNPRFLAFSQPPLPSQQVGSQKQMPKSIRAKAQVMHIANSMETPVRLSESMQTPKSMPIVQE
ncbi:hypothetical protein L7F22_035178 [Adiantum nelumboides]|nr:hypothetical protein [Adiantum nelumboides]